LYLFNLESHLTQYICLDVISQNLNSIYVKILKTHPITFLLKRVHLKINFILNFPNSKIIETILKYQNNPKSFYSKIINKPEPFSIHHKLVPKTHIIRPTYKNHNSTQLIPIKISPQGFNTHMARILPEHTWLVTIGQEQGMHKQGNFQLSYNTHTQRPKHCKTENTTIDNRTHTHTLTWLAGTGNNTKTPMIRTIITETGEKHYTRTANPQPTEINNTKIPS